MLHGVNVDMWQDLGRSAAPKPRELMQCKLLLRDPRWSDNQPLLLLISFLLFPQMGCITRGYLLVSSLLLPFLGSTSTVSVASFCCCPRIYAGNLWLAANGFVNGSGSNAGVTVITVFAHAHLY